MAHTGFHRIIKFFITILFVLSIPITLSAQDVTPTPIPDDAPPQAPDRVDVAPEARDDQIETRLQDILSTTGWFIEPTVRVEDGVVFLTGETESNEFKTWATDLANNTQDVAAVVN
ncbi:MAG: BON domain-containing protein [Chloroflexota bacterium]